MIKKFETSLPLLHSVKKLQFDQTSHSTFTLPASVNEQSYLYQIINALPAVNIFWKDIDGHYLGCNQNVLELAGISSLTDFIGKTDFDLPWAHEAKKLRKMDEKVIKLKKSINERQSVLLKNKRYYYFTSRYPLLNENQQIIGVIGLSFNITAQVEAENRTKIAKKSEKEAHKKTVLEREFRESAVILAGSIAHDLKNPLAGMVIYSDLINQGISSVQSKLENLDVNEMQLAEIRHFFSEIESWNTKMRENINDMHSFINTTMNSISRLLTDSLTAEDYELCEIEPCLYDIIHHYPFKSHEKQLIHLNIQDNFQFLGSPVLIYRVIANLVNNALRQIHLQKRGEIYITTAETVSHNLVKIKDTAGNVAAEKIKNIFHTYKDRSYQNTGIGLKFCKVTMQSFGGDITCDVVDKNHIEFTLHFLKL